MTDVRHSYRQQVKNVVTGNSYIKVRCSLSREVAMNDSVKGLAQSSAGPSSPYQPTLLRHCWGFQTAVGTQCLCWQNEWALLM